jgi:hypothetical protein
MPLCLSGLPTRELLLSLTVIRQQYGTWRSESTTRPTASKGQSIRCWTDNDHFADPSVILAQNSGTPIAWTGYRGTSAMPVCGRAGGPHIVGKCVRRAAFVRASVMNRREPRLEELNNLKLALATFAFQLDAFEARISVRSLMTSVLSSKPAGAGIRPPSPPVEP